jgi:hypothetical protein
LPHAVDKQLYTLYFSFKELLIIGDKAVMKKLFIIFAVIIYCFIVIGCSEKNPSTGNNGDIGKAVYWPKPRFTDHNNGTVTDNLTGLTWLKNTNVSAAKRDWVQAMRDIRRLNLKGEMNGHNAGDISNNGTHMTDWRLPKLEEMQSLIYMEKGGPLTFNKDRNIQWPAGEIFKNKKSHNHYWTSTQCPCGNWEEQKYFINMNSGYMFGAEIRSHIFKVWAVRGTMNRLLFIGNKK